MPDAHARLSPSASERWISCPASVQLSERLPTPPDSVYAREGTCAHALADIEGRHEFGQIADEERDQLIDQWRDEFSDVLESELPGSVESEMREHVTEYLMVIHEAKKRHPYTQVLFEQRMAVGVPSSWGTSDCVLVSPWHVESIDLKYGTGVTVSARKNPQLRSYSCGALDTFGDILGDTEDVYMTVVQPRLDHIETEHLTADELRAWRRDVLAPAADEALGDNPSFGPSEEACRWCPASGQCKAQLEFALDNDFGQDVDLLSDEEMAEQFGQIGFVKQWLTAMEEAALTRAYAQGRQLPGWKVVASGGKRVVSDPDGAIDKLVELGHSVTAVTNTKIKGIGDLEKLVGKKELPTLLGEFITKTDGKPSLVAESDKRPSITPTTDAIADFGDDLPCLQCGGMDGCTEGACML